MPRPTLAHVAGRAGVSRTTASNAYNRPDQLSAVARERVLAAARELGYAGPDPVARSLRTGRAGAIGLVLGEALSYAFEDPAAVRFLGGLASAVEGAALGLLIVPGTGPATAEDPRVVGDVVARAAVDGFCVYSVATDDPVLAAARGRGLPLVVVDQPRADGTPFVGIDDRAACRAVAEHVVALGHRRVGVLAFSLSDDGHAGPVSAERQAAATFEVSAARLAGYADGLATGGVQWTDVAVDVSSLNGVESGAVAAAALLERAPDVTAILCLSDVLALGALAAVRARGRSVPGDVSVVGFDDIPEAARADPPLTTVRQPTTEKGRLAGELLLAGATDTTPRILAHELVVRASTAPPPAHGQDRS